MHSRSAGVDHLLFPALVESPVVVTNAQGQYSSSLAEYCMLGCLFFAKDVQRLQAQQREAKWEKFVVKELRGATIGIIGYGDIGRACAKLAHAFGMRVLAQRRRPELSADDPLVHKVYGPGEVGDLVAESDYILLAAALTPETRNIVGEAELARAKASSVLINLGRGPLVDEDALANYLKEGKVAGAVLDVFCQEPLPPESPLWGMPQVLLSPHNADMTADFLHTSVRRFAQNAGLFLEACRKGQDPSTALDLHIVDKTAGY